MSVHGQLKRSCLCGNLARSPVHSPVSRELQVSDHHEERLEVILPIARYSQLTNARNSPPTENHNVLKYIHLATKPTKHGLNADLCWSTELYFSLLYPLTSFFGGVLTSTDQSESEPIIDVSVWFRFGLVWTGLYLAQTYASDLVRAGPNLNQSKTSMIHKFGEHSTAMHSTL
jgi:hypothetical protein